MSVAYDLTEVPLAPADPGLPRRHRLAAVPEAAPPPARRTPACAPVATPARGGGVAELRPPLAAPTAAAPVRLTRRGIGVLTIAIAAACAGVWWLAANSAAGGAAAGGAQHVPSTLTVAPGDTLWDIAARAAPQRDPRAEVADLQRRNHLTEAAIVPGQVLHLR